MGLTDKVKESAKKAASQLRGTQSTHGEGDQEDRHGETARHPTEAELDRAEAESRKQAAEREAERTRPSS